MVLYAEAVNFYVKDSGAQLKTFKLGYDMIDLHRVLALWRGRLGQLICSRACAL